MTVEQSNAITMPPQKPLRVLHITFNMGIGGTEQVIRQLVQGMVSEGVESEILCIDGHIGPIGETLQQSGVPVHKVVRKQGFDWPLIKAIRKHLREGRFDVVHCHQYTPWMYGWLAALPTRAKVVFTEHGRFYPDRYRYKAMLINPVMALFTPSILAISKATKDALVKYEFIPRKKIQVIYNGIAPLERDEAEATRIRDSLGIPKTAFVVGTVSRLDPVKNQAMMLRAFKQFSEKQPDSYLLMVGDGPDKDKLISLASEFGITKRTIFTGFINNPVHYLAAMDVFLLSSHTEGTSMTLLEAMSLEIPAIATWVGGNPEIIEDEVTGLLVEPDDSESFALSIEQLYENLILKQSMGKAARLSFDKRFSAGVMVFHYSKIYRNANPTLYSFPRSRGRINNG
ncbi:Glycosyltransferase involved in cell wall bisynthesis [Marinobacter antarcticus]|uniref:Glycosyltransferase involved in cell wall bisynthesis n=1 Tax=Marinobacter antarcticus TaxID=564117 RepID=A0A1M6SMY4_9GAMM|nr:glycosyltransferase [Marinobacter antarcticus]SHK45958.1 Glycosyltransferase involved in cell wall bisynthesis [Marinobacter antarcticus]